uniref:Large ribosomal subunit protein mL50 n=3 Tax=Lygus hesperus TaxID=30085 RepID=A0A0A9YG27_LYGHE
MFATVVGSQPSNLRTVIPPQHKFALFGSCFETFNHSIPNSILHRINTFGDLIEFYLTPVDTTLPLDKFKTVDLPPNLHVQYEPIRFHPDDDKMFNGQTAFPKSNTLVTGLRTKRKYKGHIQTDTWPLDY